MRTNEEIEHALNCLMTESGFLDWKGDNFRYGYLIGKISAIDWALGGAPGSDVGIHFDYEGWQREQKEAADEWNRR